MKQSCNKAFSNAIEDLLTQPDCDLGATNGDIEKRVKQLIGRCGKGGEASWSALVPELIQMGTPSVVALVNSLRHGDDTCRYGAASLLGAMGNCGEGVALSLADALSDKDLQVCRAAAWALGQMHAYGAFSIMPLTEALYDDDDVLRECATWSLGQIGLWDEEAVPSLIEALQDQSAAVRRAAALWLGEIGETTWIASEAGDALIEALRDSDVGVRDWALWAIGEIGGLDEVLIECLNDPWPAIRRTAVFALLNREELLTDLASRLVGALQDEDVEIRVVAGWILARTSELSSETAGRIVSAMTKALCDSNAHTRMYATITLGLLGLRGQAGMLAVPDLVKLLDMEGKQPCFVRDAACEALECIVSNAATSIQIVLTALRKSGMEDSERSIRGKAIVAAEAIRSVGVQRQDRRPANVVWSVPIAKGYRSVETEKSLLALLNACTNWKNKEKVSERLLHGSPLLKTKRRQLGLPERASKSAVHYHLKALAKLCEIRSLLETDKNRQFSRFHDGVTAILRNVVKPMLETAIQEKAAGNP